MEQGYDASSLEFALVIPGYDKTRGKENKFPTIVSTKFYSASVDKRTYFARSEPFRNAFLLQGKYKGARVEHDKENNIFNVYDPTQHDWAWEVFRGKPGQQAEAPLFREAFWLGSCSNPPTGVLGLECWSTFIYKNYYIVVDIPGSNIQHRDKIKDFIISQLESWRKGE